MVAPKGPGQRVRELYQDGFGIPSLVAVHQDYSKKAWDKVLGMAKAIGRTVLVLLKQTSKKKSKQIGLVNRLIFVAAFITINKIF